MAVTIKKRDIPLISLVTVFLALAFPGSALCTGEFDLTFASGNAHFLAVTQDGTLWSWGDNEYGQLGDGTFEGREHPVKIMAGVKAVSAGFNTSFALKEDGTLWAFGETQFGQAGVGDMPNVNKPVKILDNVKDVVGDHFVGMAIREDGSLWAWGYNGHGSLGTGSYEYPERPVKIINSGVVRAAFGGNSAYAVMSDGTLLAWGKNNTGQTGVGEIGSTALRPAKSARGIMSIAGGNQHAIGFNADGKLFLWGDPTATYSVSAPDGASLADVSDSRPEFAHEEIRQVAAHDTMNAVVTGQGQLFTFNGRETPWNNGCINDDGIPMIIDDVAAASVTSDRTVFLKTDGSLWRCGPDRMVLDQNGNQVGSFTPVMIFEGVKLP